MALAASLVTDGVSGTNATSYDLSAAASTAGDFYLLFVLHQLAASAASQLMARPSQQVGSAPWNSWPVAAMVLEKPAAPAKTILECWGIAPKTNAGTGQIRLQFADTQDAVIWSLVKVTGTGLAATPDFTAGDGTAPYHGFKCVRQVGVAAASDAVTTTASEARAFSSRTPSTSILIAAFAAREDLNGAPTAGWTELSDRKNTTPALCMQVNKSTPGATGYSPYATETLASITDWATLLVEVPVLGSTGYTTLPERAIYA